MSELSPAFASDIPIRGEAVLPAQPLPEWVNVAQVTAPQGLRGQVKVTLLTGTPERFEKPQTVRLYPPLPGQPSELLFQLVRWQGERGVGRLAGVSSRDQAERMRGRYLQVPRQQCPPLPEGQFYLFQLVGMNVWSEQGEYLGQLEEVLAAGGNDVYLVRHPGSGRALLVPAIRQVVREVDVEGRQMRVQLLPGMMPESEAGHPKPERGRGDAAVHD